ncbi:smkA [Symbiodinium microadriaticum]|nr:smkA [Symbiodinium microadriaticum]
MRAQVAKECMDPQFIAALRQAFHIAEDAGAEQELVVLWRIVKGVFLLADAKATQRYLRQDLYEDVMGMLEYDEGIPKERRICHRQMLKVAVRFKEVLTFQDAEMLELIHLNYRVQYLKDAVLPRVLDDAAFASLSNLVISNNTVLLHHLEGSEPLMKQLFDGLRQKEVQSLLFLQDACRLAKSMQPVQRQKLYKRMLSQGMFEVLIPFLSPEENASSASEAPLPHHMAMEILVQSALVSQDDLKMFMHRQALGPDPGEELLDILIRMLFRDPDHGVQSQVADVLQLVMSWNGKVNQKQLDSIYALKILQRLACPLIQTPAENNPRLRLLSQSEAYAIQVVCELLAFAVANHRSMPLSFMTEHKVAYKATALVLAAPHRHLQLAPVRLVKAMVKAMDHIYLWELLECNVFGLLFDFLGRSMQLPGLGGGAFVSAMSELLDVIRMQNAKPLVTGLCEQYRGILEALSQNVKSVAALLERDAKNKEEKAQQEARQQKKSSLRRARQFTDLAGEGLVDEEAKNIGIAAHAPAQAPDLQAHAPTVEEVGGDDDAAFNRPVITPFASDSSDDSDDSDSSDSSAISEDSDSDGDYEQPEGEEEEESSSDDDHEEVVSAQVANGSPMPVVTATPSGGATETACEESMAQSGDAAGATANEVIPQRCSTVGDFAGLSSDGVEMQESLDNCTIEELKAMISREIMEASPRNGDGTASAEAKAAPAPPKPHVSGTPHSVARATCDKSWNRYRRFLAGAAAKGVEVWPPKVQDIQDSNQQAGARLSHAPKRARMETPAPVPA